MRVRCISQKGESLTKEYIDPRVNITKETDFRLTRGKEYLVYALAVRRDQVWYYVIDDCELWYPRNIPAPIFEIADDRVSRFWTVKLTPGNPDHDVLLAFEEWDSKDLFYDRLTDRFAPEVSLFEARKLQMDQEF
jgi:hypothetical protein